jgi:hypothetical protein
MNLVHAGEIDGIKAMPRLHGLKKTVAEYLRSAGMQIRVIVADEEDLGFRHRRYRALIVTGRRAAAGSISRILISWKLDPGVDRPLQRP